MGDPPLPPRAVFAANMVACVTVPLGMCCTVYGLLLHRDRPGESLVLVVMGSTLVGASYSLSEHYGTIKPSAVLRRALGRCRGNEIPETVGGDRGRS